MLLEKAVRPDHYPIEDWKCLVDKGIWLTNLSLIYYKLRKCRFNGE